MPHYPISSNIRKLFEKGQPLTFAKGEIIIGNDNEPNGIYYISTGYVKVYSINDNGSESLHIIYGLGELFPLVWAYLDIEGVDLYYEAMSDTSVWRLSKGWFREYIKSSHEICYDMSVQLAQQFRIYADRLDNLEFHKASDRVIYRLLFLASRFGIREGNDIRIDIPLTHEIIANSVGLARESVSREAEKLEKSNLIQRTGQNIVLKDVDALVQKVSRPLSLKTWQFP
jgi:CRP/FNR family transcriptional regulator